MGYQNLEGCSLPVAGSVIQKADLVWRLLVFICSPYAGNMDANIRNTRRCSRFPMGAGVVLLAPYLLPQCMLDWKEQNPAMFMDKVFIGLCGQVMGFGSIRFGGMKAGIARAERKRIPVRCFTEDPMEADT